MIDWRRLVDTLWGEGTALAPLAMAVRALTMFFLLLMLVRLGGARSFGRKSSFDNALVMMLGAIAARGVVGASPFTSTVVASAVVVAVHRLIARLCVTHGGLAKWVEGEPVPIYRNGLVLHENLKRTNISEADLQESRRLELQRASLGGEEAFVERNGRISFVRPEQ